MIVVSDTSPLTYLILIDAQDVQASPMAIGCLRQPSYFASPALLDRERLEKQ